MEAIYSGIRRLGNLAYLIYYWCPVIVYKKIRDNYLEKWEGPLLDKFPTWITPDRLTVSRAWLALPVCIISFWPEFIPLVIILFSVGWITDHLDGALARRRGIVSRIGKLRDPLADKILNDGYYVLCLTGPFSVEVKMTISVILVADVASFLLGLIAYLYLENFEGSSVYGKAKYVFQCASIILILQNSLYAPPFLFAAALLGVLSVLSYVVNFVCPKA